jgi:4-carboxymuconolactone decarboxylase
MSRVTVPAELSAEQQVVADRVVKSIGRLGGPYTAWINRPELCSRINHLSDYFRSGTVLPPKLRLIGVLMAIRHWRAGFPWSAQVPNALSAGLTEAQVTAIADGKIPSFTNPDEEAAYQVAAELLERGSLGDATYNRALDRLGLNMLVELVVVVGHFTTVSLTASAFAIDPRPVPIPIKG